MSIIQRAKEIAADLIDTAAWVLQRLEVPSELARLEEAIGSTGEIIAPVCPGGTGQVMIVLSGSRHTFGAKAVDSMQEFQRGEKVKIVQVGQSIMYVGRPTAIETGCVSSAREPDRDSELPE